jgi:hypothetical protein
MHARGNVFETAHDIAASRTAAAKHDVTTTTPPQQQPETSQLCASHYWLPELLRCQNKK